MIHTAKSGHPGGSLSAAEFTTACYFKEMTVDKLTTLVGGLKDIKKDGVSVLCPEDNDCYPFSLVLLFDSPEERERVRKELIAHQVYPTILWNIPVQANDEIVNEIVKFSRKMLSIHCDVRYTKDEIREMKSIIESII